MSWFLSRNQRTRIHIGGVRFCFPYHFIHQNHTPNVNRVNGAVVTTYTHHILETTKLGLPGPFVSRAKKLVPKKLHTKVAWQIQHSQSRDRLHGIAISSYLVSNFCALLSNSQTRDTVAIGCEIVELHQQRLCERSLVFHRLECVLPVL